MNKHIQQFKTLVFSTLTLGLLMGPFVSSAFALDCNDQASGNWSTSGTWTSCGGGTPDGDDNVTIDTFNVTLDADEKVNNLIISTGSLDLDGYNLTIFGSLDLDGTLLADSGTGGNTTVTIEGTWDMTNGVFTSTDSTVIFVGTSSYAITSDGKSFNNFMINGTIGLLAYWKMDELSDNDIVIDYSGNAINGTASNFGAGGGPSVQVSTMINYNNLRSLEFDGADDVVNMGNSAITQNVNTFTYCAWIYPQSQGETSDGRIIHRGTNSVRKQFHTENSIANSLRLAVDRATTRGLAESTANTMDLNVWQHVCGTYSESDGPRIYKNGTEISYGTRTVGSGTTSDDSGDDLHIGNRSTGDRTWDGFIDEVRIYNRILSTTEITALANGNMPSGGLGIYTLQDNFDANGTVTLNDGELDIGSSILRNVGGSWLNHGGVFTVGGGGGQTTFDGSGTILSGSQTFRDVAVSASGTYTLADNIATTSGFDVNAGTLTYATSTIIEPITVNGAAQFSGTGVFTGQATDFRFNDNLNIMAGTFTAPTGVLQVGGDFDHTGGTFTNSSSTVMFTGTQTHDFNPSASTMFNSIVVEAGAGSYTLQAALDINGTLRLGSGTLDVSATDYQINVASHWINNGGTFIEQNGTVVLDGTTQSILSSEAFYHLSKTDPVDNNTDVTLTFTAGTTTTVAGSLTLNGMDDLDRVNLLSSSPGTRFNISVATIQDTTWLDVTDSEALGADINSLNSLQSNTDAGEGTPEWVFSATGDISGTTNLGDGITVRVAAGGALQAEMTTTSGGAWTISSVVMGLNDHIVVWADGVVDVSEANGVTVYDGVGNITGMVLNTGTLSIGSDTDNANVTITGLGQYDNDDNEDIIFSSNSGTLLVDDDNVITDEGLDILVNNTLSLATTEGIDGKNITINGTLDLTGVSNIIMNGTPDWVNNGNFNAGTGTVTMDRGGTAGASTITGSTTFYGLTLDASSTNDIEIYSNLTVSNDFRIEHTGAGSGGYGVDAVSGPHNITLLGDFIHSGTTNVDPNLNIVFNGTGTQKITSLNTPQLPSLQISNTAASIELATNILVSGTMRIDASATLDVTSSNYMITMQGVGLGITDWVNSGSFVSQTGTVAFEANGGTGDVQILSPETFYNFEIIGASSADLYIGGALLIQNDFTNSHTGSGQVFDSGGPFDMDVQGDVYLNGNQDLDVDLNVQMTGTTTQTVFYTSTGGFGDFQVSNTVGEVVMAGTLEVADDITVDANATLDLRDEGVDGEAITVFTVNGTLELEGDQNFISATPTFSTTSWAEYTATGGTRNIQSWAYDSLEINGAGGTFTLPGDIVLVDEYRGRDGTLDTDDMGVPTAMLTVGGTFEMFGGNFTANSSTVSMGNDILIGTTGGLFTAGTSTVIFNGSMNVSNPTETNAFHNGLQTNGTTLTLTGSVGFGSTGVFTTGDATSTIQTNGSAQEFMMFGSSVVSDGGVVWTSATATGDLQIAYFDASRTTGGGNYGLTNFTVEIDNGNTLTLGGSLRVGQFNYDSPNVGDDLTFDANGFTVQADTMQIGMLGFTDRYATFNAQTSTVEITTDFTIYPSDASGDNIFDGQMSYVDIGDDWLNQDTFTPGTSTVNFSGTVIDITGSTTFYNLIIEEAVNDFTDTIVTFEAGGTFVIGGTMRINGLDANDRVNLYSSIPGTRWNISVTSGIGMADFIDVTDSEVVGSNDIQTANTLDTDNNDSGEGSPQWVFTIPGTINISGSSNLPIGTTIRVAATGSLQGMPTTTTAGDGSWTLMNAPGIAVDEVIVVWADVVGESSETTGVTLYDGTGNITGMILTTNILTIGSDEDTVTTVADLSTFDNDDDEDVMFTANAGVFTVDGAGTYTDGTLHILSGDTLTLGATETLNANNVVITGTLNTLGVTTINVTDGNWANTGIFIESTSVATFTSTAGDTDTISGSSTFYDMNVTGAGTYQLSAGTVIADNSFVLTGGTFDINDQTFTMNDTFTLTTSWLKTGTGVVTFGDAGADSVTVNSGTLTIESDATDTDIVINAGTWTNNGGRVIYDSASSSTTVFSTIEPYYDLIIDSVGSTFTANTAITVNSTLTITAGTVDLDGYNTTVVGNTIIGGAFDLTSGAGGNVTGTFNSNWDATGGTFTATDSTVILSGTVNQILTSNSNPFNNLEINGSFGLVGYWKFDETASPSYDSSGNDISGTWGGGTNSSELTGNTTFDNPNSLFFDGSNDTVFFGDEGNISGSTGVTISAWIRPTATAAASNTILWRGVAGGSTRGYSLYYASTDELTFRVTTTSTGAGGNANFSSSTSPISTLNVWYHVAATYSSTDNTMRIYVNGSQVASSNATASGTMLDSGTLLQSGTADSLQRDFNGYIDDLRLYNYGISATSVQHLANGNSLGEYVLQDNLDVNGTLTINNGHLDVGTNRTINAAESWLNYGGVFTAAAGQVNFDGAAGSHSILSGEQSFYNVDVTGAATWSLDQDVIAENLFDISAGVITYTTNASLIPITLTGPTTLTGGTFTGTSTHFRHNGSVDISVGTYTAPTDLLEIDGAFTHSGGTFTNSSSTVMFGATTSVNLDTTAGTIFHDVIFNDGLMGYWKLDEDSSPSYDSSGFAHHGTWQGTPVAQSTATPLEFNNPRSLEFNSTDDFVRIADDDDFKNFTEFTLSAWFISEGTQASAGSRIISKSDGGTADDYCLYMDGDTEDVTFRLTTASQTNITSTSTYQDSAWHHVAGVWDGSNMSLYIDGILEAGPTAKAGILQDSAEPLSIGRHDNSSSRDFVGNIDDVRVYKRALSVSEIQNMSNGNMPGTGLGTYTLQTDLDINGSLVLNDGTLNTGTNRIITVEDNWMNYGGILSATSGTVQFNGTTTDNLILSGSQTFFSAEITGSGTWTLQDNLPVTGTMFVPVGVLTYATDTNIEPVSIFGGTAINGGTFTGQITDFKHGGNILVSAGSYTASSQDTYIDGSFTHAGGTFTNGSGTVIFTGTTTHVIDTTAGANFNNMMINTGLVGYWKFDEAASPSRDYSGYGAHGIWAGGTSATTDRPGQLDFNNPRAIDFDGSNDYIVAPHREVQNTGPGSITVAMWVFAVDGSGDEVFMRKMESTPPTVSADLQFNVEFDDSANEFDFYFSNTAGALQGGFGMSVATVAQWNHVAFSYDGAFVRGYINGVNTLTTAETDLMFEGKEVIHFGTDGAFSQDYSGMLDEARLYNRVLTDAEIQRLANGKTGSTSGGTYTLQTDLDINGSLVINDGVLNTGSNRTINVASSWQNNGGVFTANMSPVYFDGAATDAVILSGSQTFYDVDFTGSGVWSLQDAMIVQGGGTIHSGTLTYTTGFEPIQYTGSLTIDGGTFTGTTTDFVHDGLLTIAFGTYTAPSANYVLTGTLAHTGGTFANNGGTMIWAGTMNITPDLTAAPAFNDLYLNDGLVGYWKFDEERAGLTAQDSSGFNRDSTPQGTGGANAYPQPVTGATDINFTNPQSLDFDGTDDYIDTGYSPTWGAGDDFSFSFWYKADNTSFTSDEDFIGIATGSVVIQVEIDGDGSRCPDDRIGLFMTDNGGSWDIVCSVDPVDDTNWHHVAVTYDVDGFMRIYVDGNIDNATTTSTNSNGTKNLNGNTLFIGAANYSPAQEFFEGNIDDFRIYDRVLSSVEVQTLANGFQDGTAGTYVMDYTLDVNGTLVNAKILDITGNTLDLEGNILQTGTLLALGSETISILTPQAIGGDVVYNGAVTSTLTADLIGYEDVEFNNNGGTWTLPDTDVTVTGSFDVTDGTVVADGDILLTLNDVNVDDTFTMGTENVRVTGFWDATGGTFTTTGTVMFTSTDAESITSNSNDWFNFILNDGLVGYWKLDETTGTIAKDFSGFAHNGSYEGNPVSSTTVSGTINYNNPASLDFDASGDVVRINNSSSIGHKLDFTAGPFSMGAWVRAHGPNGTIIGKRDGGSGNRQYQLSIENGTGNTRFHWGGQSEDAYGSDTIVQLNTWYHLFVVVDSSGDPQIYINGVAETVADANGTRPHVFTHQSTDISIGARWAGDPATAFLFDGEIDEVRIYNRALTSTEILRLARGNQPETALSIHTLQDPLSVDGSLIINAGELNTGSDQNVTASGNWLNHGGVYTPNSNTTLFDATVVNRDILTGGTGFNIVDVNGVGGDWTTLDSMDVNNTYTLNNGTFLNQTGTMSVAGNFTLAAGVSFTGNSTLLLDGDLTFTDNTGPLQDVGWVVIGLSPDTTDLATDMAAKSLTVTATDNFYTNGFDLDISGTIDISGTFDATDDVEMDETTINVGRDFIINAGAIFVPDQSTLIMDGTMGTFDLTTDGSFALYNLTIDSAGAGALIIEVEDPLNVDGTILITDGTLDVVSGENNQINVAGSWINNDTFVPRVGTVEFDGVTQSIIGVSTFYNFASYELTDNGVDRTLTFEAGRTFTIDGTLSLRGLDDNDRINLLSDTPGSRFAFDVTDGNQRTFWLDITDSESSSNDILSSRSNDVSNNDTDETTPFWIITIGEIYEWTGTSDGATWEDQGNWNIGDGSPGNDGYPDDNFDEAFILMGSDNIDTPSGTLTIAGLYTDPTFSGSITLTGTLEADNAMGLNGDVRINGGTLDHLDNTTTESNKIIMPIDGDFILGSMAQINVDGLGYDADNGPGQPSGNRDGGAYGGSGGNYFYYNSAANTAVYGSITAPVNIGSGGATGASGSSGGGAAILTVTGTTTIHGTITAGGADGGEGAGSGGSIYITTGSLIGTGTLQAKGGNGAIGVDGRGSGGGGRIAVVLTSTGADFMSWTGTITAFGGESDVFRQDGAAGTVYLETESVAAGTGTLIVDNNNLDAFGRVTTLMPTSVNVNNFNEIIIRNNGNLGVDADDTYAFSTGNLVVSGAEESYVTIMDDTLVTFPDPFTLANYTLNAEGVSAVSGDWTIASMGRLSHTKNSNMEDYLLNLTITGSLTVDSGGEVNVDTAGYAQRGGPGAPSTSRDGGSYGGRGGDHTPEANTPITYGSITAPVNIGSGSRTDDNDQDGAGGAGAIILTVTGTTTLNGTFSAVGETSPHFSGGGGSGGSIYLTTNFLVGSGTFIADGGDATAADRGGGGGGRIALILTGTNADLMAFTGTMHAYGGPSNGDDAGAAGTVYTQTNIQGAGNGILTIDNQNRNPDTANGVVTTLDDEDANTMEVVGSLVIVNGAEFTIGADDALTVGGTNDTLFIEAGTTLVNNGTLVLGGDAFSTFGSIDFNNVGNTIVYIGEDTDLGSPILVTQYYNLTMDNLDNLFTMFLDIDVNGTFLVMNGTFNQNTSDLNVAGNFIIESTGEFIKATGGTLFLDGDQIYYDYTSPQQDVGFVVADPTTTLGTDLTGSSLTIAVNDTLITDGYNIYISGTMDINGTLDAALGTGGTTTMHVGGIWDATGGLFTSTSSTVMFTGTTSGLTITSNGQSFNNFIINGSVGLLGYWKLDETSSPAIDYSGFANHGTWNGTTSTINVTGTINYNNPASASFPGVTEYIQTTSTALKTAENFTIALWFKTDDTAFARMILWQGGAAGNGFGAPSEMSISLGNISGGSLPDILAFNLGNTDEDIDTNILMVETPFSDTTSWHHVAVTASNMSTAPEAELFVNGVSVDTDTTTTLARTDRSTWDTALRFGRPGNASRFYNGLLDEVRIYGRALTQPEIQRLANGYMPGTGLGTYTLQDNFDVNGTLSLNDGTLALGSSIIRNISGSWLNHGGILDTTAAGGQTAFDGTGIILSGSQTFRDVAISASGTYTLWDNIAVESGFDVNAGTLTYATSTIIEPIIVTGDSQITGTGVFTGNARRFRFEDSLNIMAGTFTAPTNVLEIDGDFDHTGGTFTNSSSTVMFTGTATNSVINTTGGATFQDLIINDGLIGYWKFDEAGTGSCVGGEDNCDSSGYDHHAIEVSTPTHSTELAPTLFANERSLEFTAAGQYTTVADTQVLSNLTGFTLAGWFQINNLGINSPLISKGDIAGNREYRFRFLNTTDNLNCHISTTGANEIGSSSGTLTYSGWTHLACTWDGSNMIIYQDGAIVAGPDAVSGTMYDAGVDLALGSYSNGMDNLNGGYMDDVRIYNRALSAAEIQLLADGNQPSTGLGTYTLQTALDVDGTLRLNSGTLDVSATDYQVNVGGDWENFGGIFNARTGTVVLDGGDQWLPASETFYNIKKQITSPSTVTFGRQSTITISGTFAMNGFDASNLLFLRSSSVGTRFNIDVAPSQSPLFLNVTDSEALSNDIRARNSIDGGNTDKLEPSPHWIFGPLKGAIIMVD